MAFLISPDALAVVTIWQEARGESYMGKVSVGEVIRNRMGRLYSSDGTVAGTVLKPWQFSGWESGDPNRIKSLLIRNEDPIVKECMDAWEQSKITTHVKGAVLYCNLAAVAVRPSWARDDKRVTAIGNHTFF